METTNLERALRGSESNEVSVALIADYFAAHELYYGHGTDNPSDEAYWLWRHLQNWDEAAWRYPPDPLMVAPAAQIAARRVEERRPLAYLINEAWFAGLRFYVDEHVLVPRSPLAELTERCCEPWCSLEAGDRILEVGTGSGCIAIALAHHCSAVSIDATDVSVEALAVAARNARDLGVADRIEFFETDLFPRGRGPYRVIISNPPYVSAADYATLPAEYLHEPRAGLLGGESGLEQALRLIAEAPQYLSKDGVLIVEVGNGAADLSEAAPDLPLVWVDFERGGEGVFVVTARQLEEYWRLNEPSGGGPARGRAMALDERA